MEFIDGNLPVEAYSVRRVLFLLASLVCPTSFGQGLPARVMGDLRRAAISSAVTASTPTNLVGFPVLAYYLADNYTTNSGNATLPDSGPNGWNLTNTVGSSCPNSSTFTIDGQKVLSFNTGQRLRSLSYTSSLPHEIIVLAYITNVSANTYFWDSYDGASRNYFLADTTALLKIGSTPGGIGDDFSFVPNRWILYDIIYTTNFVQCVFTNNVSADIWATPTEVGMSGFTLMDFRSPGGYGMALGLTEIYTYGGGNAIPGTNSAARAAIYNDIKSRHPSAALP